MSNLLLPFDDTTSMGSNIDERDRAARERAVDPRFNVALEASAGTGKTRVLVDRYVNLLREGVDPANILAITFTRKAASEMRERILATLRAAAERGEIAAARWRQLRDRTADIGISTIDAFCLSLLREFPLEADLDPGFSMADETEVPRLIDESLDRALRICRAVARDDDCVGLVFAQLGDRRARAGLAVLLNRRIVAPSVLSRYLARAPRDLTVAAAARAGASGLLAVFDSMRGGLERFVETGPPEAAFTLLTRHLTALRGATTNGLAPDPAAVQSAYARAREHFLTQDGEPRKTNPYRKALFFSETDWQVHRDLVIGHAPAVAEAYAAYRRDLNVLVSRGVARMYAIAESEYRRTLESHAVLDFSDVLLKALELLRQMEEFAQSRYRLEGRYHHVLVDEFQDTSRAQWDLVSLLVQSWGEGAGVAHSGPLPPSIFIVGDRKQSIYGFRDADVSVLREASRYLETLRPDGDVRRSISRSFRSVPRLLAFINDVCADMERTPARVDSFEFEEDDRFPVEASLTEDRRSGVSDDIRDEALGIITADTPEACAEDAAAEIARLITEGAPVRDRDTGIARPLRAGDVGILFRTRESHREFEAALARRGIPSYVYKGLGFFDSDEIKDMLALISYLADPVSDLRAAAWMRSRFVRISDEGLRVLAPRLADALLAPAPPTAAGLLAAADDAALSAARSASQRWVGLVDRVPPAELLDTILDESAYTLELRGARFHQARENLKKLRALMRRIQNRGYATFSRIASHLDRLSVGDEANAAIDAVDAVNLMTVHAAKGLEFPVVFVVNLARGTGNWRDPIRVVGSQGGDASVAVGDFHSNADEDEPAREREETKRLLYVAVTRARDRLYLASVLKEGRVHPGRGSLAEVLPSSLLEKFGEAAGGGDVEWPATSGAVHRFRVARHRRDAEPPTPDSELPNGSFALRVGSWKVGVLPDDFAPIDDRATRITVAGAISGDAPASTPATGAQSTRLVGVLVHRLLQRVGMDPDLDDRRLAAILAGLIRRDEGPDIEDTKKLVSEVLVMYRAISGRADLRDLYTSGKVFHEVPFSFAVEAVVVRGAIDCVIQAPGLVTVLEFKTGRRDADHERQAALYRQAVEAMFPGEAVEARVVYADEGPKVFSH
jgi:ATP-dependent helicase/nuclease subunit A